MSTAAELLSVLERRLATLRKTRPDLEDALALQELLLRTTLSSARPPIVHSFPFPREVAIVRLQQGIPLLHDQPVLIDVEFAADLFSRLVEELERRDGADLRDRLNLLIQGAARIDPQQLFSEAFVQHSHHLAQIAHGARVDAELLETLARGAVRPLLNVYAQRLLPHVEHAEAWNRGYCPVCGGWPVLGELRGVELAQWLRCSACGSGWRTQRLVCPYCSNNDYRTLGTLTLEGEQRFRIAVCERCRGYLKVGNAFDPTPAELLALDDVASLHLDIAAIERGYQRPAGSGFEIELALPEAEWVEELA